MSFNFHIEHFEGPLDLLLQLVEKEDLDISTLSLAHVADQFVQHMHANPRIPLEEIADFLVVAAKLLHLKSRLLLPSFDASEAEEEDEMGLGERLRRYRAFVEASKHIQALWHDTYVSFPREARALRHHATATFSPPQGVTAGALADAMRRIIARNAPLTRLAIATIGHVVTLQEKIHDLTERVKTATRMTFLAFLGRKASKDETTVSFLALLELVKQRCIRVSQRGLFQDIAIEYRSYDA